MSRTSLLSLLRPLRIPSTPSPSLTLPSTSLLVRHATRGRHIYRNIPSASTPVRRVSADLQFQSFKPITPSLRHRRDPLHPHLSDSRPVLSLTIPRKKKGGRDNHGHITARGRGGGAKQRIRLVDFKREKAGPHDVVRIEYDPARTAHIALIRDRDSEEVSYILAPEGLRAGDTVQSFRRGVPRDFLAGLETEFSEGGESKDAVAEAVVEERKQKEDQQRLQALPDPAAPQQAGPPPPAGGSASSDEGPIGALPGSVGGQEIALHDSESASDLSRRSRPASATSPTSDRDRSVNPYDLITDLSSLNIGLFRTLAIKPGNVLPLSLIPNGTAVHCLAITPQGKAQLMRSAGTWGTVVKTDDGQGWAHVKLKSGEVRKVLNRSCATVGMVSNSQHQFRVLGKAGRARRMGRRPKVRGMAMNATDHPHGGGRGKSKGGKHPRTPWGIKTKGLRTRRPGPKGNRMVVEQRPRLRENRR